MRAYLAIAERVARILRYSHTVPRRTLTADIIINVRAGALAHRGRFKRVRRIFSEFTAGIEGAQRDGEALVVHYHFTQYHGHAREIARRTPSAAGGRRAGVARRR
jgi:hypothetical protein